MDHGYLLKAGRVMALNVIQVTISTLIKAGVILYLRYILVCWVVVASYPVVSYCITQEC